MGTSSFCVYFHINPVKQEVFYVGAGTLERPFQSLNRSKFWKDTVNKYDYEIIIIHSNLTWKQACKLEIKYIAQIGRRITKEGPLVNITKGGEGFRGKHTPETKLKMSLASKGHKRNTGRTLSLETKIKIGKANSLKKRTIEQKENLRKKALGNKNMLGKHHSEETKEKLRLARKNYKHSEETKKKISLKNKGKIPWNKGIVKPKTILKGPGKGKFKRSEEFKAKLSAMKRGKLRGPYKKLAKQNKEITISPI